MKRHKQQKQSPKSARRAAAAAKGSWKTSHTAATASISRASHHSEHPTDDISLVEAKDANFISQQKAIEAHIKENLEKKKKADRKNRQHKKNDEDCIVIDNSPPVREASGDSSKHSNTETTIQFSNAEVVRQGKVMDNLRTSCFIMETDIHSCKTMIMDIRDLLSDKCPHTKSTKASKRDDNGSEKDGDEEKEEDNRPSSGHDLEGATYSNHTGRVAVSVDNPTGNFSFSTTNRDTRIPVGNDGDVAPNEEEKEDNAAAAPTAEPLCEETLVPPTQMDAMDIDATEARCNVGHNIRPHFIVMPGGQVAPITQVEGIARTNTAARSAACMPPT